MTRKQFVKKLAGEIKTKHNPDGFRTYREAREILDCVDDKLIVGKDGKAKFVSTGIYARKI